MKTSSPIKADDPAGTGTIYKDEDQLQRDYTLIESLAQDAQNMGDSAQTFEDLARATSRLAPELPAYAQLPDHIEGNMHKCGRFLNMYVKFARKASPMTAQIFHDVLGLTLLATVIARRVAIKVSTTEIFPNLYALLIAPSTQYRKSTAFKIPRDILKAADLKYLLLPGRMTPESMITELSGNKPQNFDNWDEESKGDWKQERLFSAQRTWLMEEAGSLINSFETKYMTGLLTTVLDFYECPEDPPANITIARGRETIRRVYLNICGPTTPSQISRFLKNPAYFDNGIWARFILVTPDTSPIWKFWEKDELKIPPFLVDHLKHLATKKLSMPHQDLTGVTPPEITRPILEHGVWERWERYSMALEAGIVNKNKVKDRYFSNYGRYATTAMKIAICLAVSDWAIEGTGNVPSVTLLHWARAQTYTEMFRESLHRLLENPISIKNDDDYEEKVIRFCPDEQSEDVVTERELAINLGMSGAQDRPTLTQWLQQMQKDGLIGRRDSQIRKRAKGYFKYP